MLKAVGFVIRPSVRKNGYIVSSSAITVTCITISKLIKTGGWARVIFLAESKSGGGYCIVRGFQAKINSLIFLCYND